MSTNNTVVSVQSHTAVSAAKPDTAAAPNAQGPPPAVGRVLNLMTATITSRVLGELSQAGVISAMAKHSEPVSAAQLATETKLNADALQRSLRLCAADDWFSESPDGKFALKDAVVLVPSAPGAVNSTLEIWSVCPSHQGPLSHFSHSLRTGDVAVKQVLQKDNLWDWFAEHQKEKMRFSEAMTSLSLPTAGVVAASIDFKPYQLYCDVGGSAGTMAFGVKQAQPHLTALSFDLASLTDDVKKNPLPGVQYVAGDFFQSVPEAEVYSMKHILHDWRDDQCITILRNIHKAMRGNGVLLLVESILPDMGDNSNALAKAVDIVMLNIASGRERTRADWDKLLKDGGFRVENVVDTPLPLKVIVCKKI